MTSEQNPIDLTRLRIQREPAPPPSGEHPRRSRWWIALAAVVILGSGVLAVRPLLSSPPEVDISLVTLSFPTQSNAVLTASGYVVAQQKAAVSSKATGRLVFLGVEEGDKVQKGEVIARIEDDDVLAALEKAKADLEVARSDDFDAAQSLERQKQLYASKLTSKADLDAAQARYSRVHAGILSAQGSVREAEVAVENTRIRAPFDGTVLTKDADVGEVVAPLAASANSRAAVVTIANMKSLQVEADVSESNITRISVDQPCEVILDANPDKRYQGKVHKIVPTADRSKATILTKVVFLDMDNRVLPEMSAKVTFLAPGARTSEENAPVLSVASAALVNRGNVPAVFRLVDGKAVETTIQTGKQYGARIQVLSGLSQGDQIILSPPSNLTSGSTVKVRGQ